MNPVELILSKLPDVRPCHGGWSARCPAHDDQRASLSVSRGEDGRVLLHCHAGCELEAILREIGLKASNLFSNSHGAAPPRSSRVSPDNRHWPTAEAALESLERRYGVSSRRWTYHDAAGEPVGKVLRWDRQDGKDIRPLARVNGVWRNTAIPAPRPLYGLPALADASDVIVVEGEPPADAIRSIGLCVTTSAGGAKAADRTDWTPLRGRMVTILPDADDPGAQYAIDVAGLLARLDPPATVKIVDLPDLRPGSGDDAVEYITARRVAGLDDAAICAELLQLAEAAPVWTPNTSLTASSTGEIPWDAPEPLGQFDLPAFPLDVVQRQLCPLWPLCPAVAESYQVPVDLPAMLALAVAGAALAKRCEVQVRPDWWEPVNLFVVVAMEPGERKSAVFREVTTPLAAFERDECERLAPEIERNRSDLRMLAAAVKNAEQEAAKLKDAAKRVEAENRAHGLVEELRQMPVLAAPRQLADDATPEALAKLLHEQGGRIALLSPEGGVFEQMAGRYSDGMPNLDVYLKGHAGDDIRIDRVSRPPEYVRRPALTVGLAVQPDVLRGLADKPGLRGRGVLARFLYSVPTSKVGFRRLNPAAVSAAVKSEYARAIRSALALQPILDANGAPAPHIIHPDRDALAELDGFRADVERSMREGGSLAALRDWALKLPGAVVRIAGILHGLEPAASGNPGHVPLNGKTMAAAVAIGRYLTEHAKAAFFEMGADPAIGVARRLLGWMRKRRMPTFTQREAFRRLRGGLIRSVRDVSGPLELLVQHGYIRHVVVEHQGPGRTPSPSYEVNPATFGHNGHNGQNSPVDRDCVHSVHSVQGNESQNRDPDEADDDGGAWAPTRTDAPADDDPQDVLPGKDQQLAHDLSAARNLLQGVLPGIKPNNMGAFQ